MNTVYQNILGLIWTYLYHVYVVVYFSFVLFLLLFLHAPMKYNVKGIWPCVTPPSLLTDGIYCIIIRWCIMLHFVSIKFSVSYLISSHLIPSYLIFQIVGTPQIAKTLGSTLITSIQHFFVDRCLIDVDPRVFALWGSGRDLLCFVMFSLVATILSISPGFRIISMVSGLLQWYWHWHISK